MIHRPKQLNESEVASMLLVEGDFRNGFRVNLPRGSNEAQWRSLSTALGHAQRDGWIVNSGRIGEYGPYGFTVTRALISELDIGGSPATVRDIIRRWLEERVS